MEAPCEEMYRRNLDTLEVWGWEVLKVDTHQKLKCFDISIIQTLELLTCTLQNNERKSFNQYNIKSLKLLVLVLLVK